MQEKEATKSLKWKKKAFNQMLSQNNKRILKVLNIDEESKTLDLSYSGADDKEKEEISYSRHKLGNEVNSIIRGVANKYHIDSIKL